MTRYKKQILKVGTYYSPDGVVEVTPERLRHWEREVARLQQARYAIPSHFDHASDLDHLQPVHCSVLESPQMRSAKNTVAHLESFRVAPDGQSAEIVIAALDPDAEKKIESNAIYVSPVIFPEWRDGEGNEYRDVITAVDLVDYPVDNSQSPFSRLGLVPVIRMGRSAPAVLKDPDMATTAKHNGVTIKSRGDKARKQRIKQAIRAGLLRMGSDYQPLDDDDDEDEDSGAPEPQAADAPPEPAGDALPTDDGEPGAVPDVPDDSPAEDLGVSPDEAPDMLDSVLNLLNEFGVTLPDDTTDSNLIPNLRVALTALLSAEGEDEDEGEGDGMPDANQIEAATPPIATLSQVRKRAKSLEEKLRQTHRDQLLAKLDYLVETGRITSAEYETQKRALQTVRLSLDSNAEFRRTEIDHFIAARETLPQGAVWDPKQRTASTQKLSAVEPTLRRMNGANGDEDTDKYVKMLLRRGT